MRIHTNLQHAVLYDAARTAHVELDFTTHGSRTRRYGHNVILRGSSTRRPNSGRGGFSDEYAATWDEWGIFLAEIFKLDPIAHSPYYMGAEDFHWQTGGRFATLVWANVHRDHKWRPSGVPCEQWCEPCGAIRRWHREARLKPTGTGFSTSALVPPRGIQAAEAFLRT